MLEFLAKIAPYRSLFLIIFEVALVVVLVILAKGLYKKLKAEYEESKKAENQPLLKPTALIFLLLKLLTLHLRVKD